MKRIIVSISIFLLAVSCEKKAPNISGLEQQAQEIAVEKIGDPKSVKAEAGTFPLYALPYVYDAFPGSIDPKTMEIHYSKHYVGYLNKLNKAVAGTPMAAKDLVTLLKTLDMKNMDVRNNAGGVYNHELYFSELKAGANAEPKGILADAIKRDFGSFAECKKQLEEAAVKRFGSGWAWLVSDATGKLKIGSTANQDNPLMPGMEISGTPILALDIWEHAYYLKYQNQRPEYVKAFFDIINWDVVLERYQKSLPPSELPSTTNIVTQPPVQTP